MEELFSEDLGRNVIMDLLGQDDAEEGNDDELLVGVIPSSQEPPHT